MSPGIVVSVVLYYFSWGLYYLGVTNAALIMGLTIFPCIAFLLFAIFILCYDKRRRGQGPAYTAGRRLVNRKINRDLARC